MTRINAGISPKNLTDAHCLAEWRELPRIPSTIVSGTAVIKDLPNEFTLNRGHVKFFYNKNFYLYKRYTELTQELIAREFQLNLELYERNITNFEYIKDNFSELWNDFEDNEAKNTLIIRISLRLSGMKALRYYKKISTLKMLCICYIID